MLLRKLSLLLLISLSTVFAQSIDEEERVQVDKTEGSANGLTDDEDMEGSSLPPDTYYATTPQLHPKFVPSTRVQTTTNKVPSSTTTMEKSTTTKMVIEVTTSESRPSMPFGTSMLFGTQGIFIILGGIITLLVILIIFVICFKARNNKKQAYRPGKRESPDALLKE